MAKNEVYNFLHGTTAKWLEEKLLRGLKDSSIYNFKGVSNITWNKITMVNGRFTYVDGDSLSYMFAYKSKFATIYWKDFPRFHTEQCRTRIEFSDFQYGSQMPVKIFCTDRNLDLGPQRLQFCRNCNRERNFFSFGGRYGSWEDVIIDIASEKSRIGYQADEIRHDGYTMDWQQVSFAIRSKSNFLCNQCGISLRDDDAFYLEVHHKDYNRRNNSFGNLEVLCVDCHSKVDAKHNQIFSHGPARTKLAAYRMRFNKGQN